VSLPELNLKKVAEYIRKASTIELLERFTLLREDMEPAALDLIEHELERRGWNREQINEFERENSAQILKNSEGQVLRCRKCGLVAKSRKWSWYRLWGKVPLFPYRPAFCAVHAPPSLTMPAS
jgi:hypothetical protein